MLVIMNEEVRYYLLNTIKNCGLLKVTRMTSKGMSIITCLVVLSYQVLKSLAVANS
jgi:hypothetical protein